MSQWVLYALAGVAVFSVGLVGIFAHEQAIRRILAANLTGSGACLVLVAFARRTGAAPDPVPHALVLTGIVVSVSATALAVALARRGAELKEGPAAAEEGPR